MEVPLETPVPLTASVAGAYLERARALPERTRSALVVSAASDTGDVALLARAAASLGLGVSDLVPAEARGLIAIRSGRLEFRHPLTRSAIYGDASAEERRRVHRALAEALPETEVDRRAWHLALGAVGPDADASSALEQAAVRARGRSAYATAADAFERAASLSAEEGRRASLVFAAADAAWLAGLDERAALLLEDAARSAGDSALSIEVEHLRGHIALRRGPIGRGREILLGAAERAAADRPEAAVVMLAEAAEGAFFAGDAAGMRACAERARELMGAADGHAAYFGLMIAGMGRILSGEGEQGADLVRKAVGLLERSEDPTSDVHLLAWAAMGPLWLRETNVGESLVDRALETARARPAAGALPHLLTHIGIEQAATDRCIEAQATFDEAIRLARETGQRTVLAGALGRLAWVEARCGREHAASANGEEALALANELGAHLFEIWALGALASWDWCAATRRPRPIASASSSKRSTSTR